MTTIYAATNDNVLVATILPKIAQNNINMVKLHVDFDSAWNGVAARSAVFTTSKSAKPYEAILSSDGNCIIPYEVLAEECKLYIYVKGVISSSNAVKTTQGLTVRVLGGTPTVIVSDPSPSIYEQLLSETLKTRRELELERERVDNIVAGHPVDETEVTDIRVSYDGVTHKNAGMAVRRQVAEIHGVLNGEGMTLTEDDFESGSWAAKEGGYYASNLRIRSTLPVSKGDVISVDPKGLYVTIIIVQDKSGVEILDAKDYTNKAFDFGCAHNGYAIFIVCKDHTVALKITPEELTSNITIYRFSTSGVGRGKMIYPVQYEMGNIYMTDIGFNYDGATTRVRTPEGYTLPLSKGDVIRLTSYQNTRFYVGWSLPNGTYGRKGWLTKDFVCPVDADYVILVCNTTDTVLPSAATLGSLIEVQTCISNGLISRAISEDQWQAQKIRQTSKRNKNIRSINHRGYNGVAPENTLAAFRLSRHMGFECVECDVSFASDGVAVILHDGTVDRTSNGTGSIADLTLEEVRALDFGSWKSEEYAGEQIPTFEEFIALCKHLGLHPYIELKMGTEAQIKGLVEVVKRYGMKGKVTWISFTAAYLGYIKAVDPTARLGYVVNSVDVAAVNVVENTLRSGTNEVFINCAYSAASAQAVELCMEADIPLEVWTVNSESAILALDAYISGVSSDKFVADALFYDTAADEKSDGTGGTYTADAKAYAEQAKASAASAKASEEVLSGVADHAFEYERETSIDMDYTEIPTSANIVFDREYDGVVLDLTQVVLSGYITSGGYTNYINHDITRQIQSIEDGKRGTFPVSGVFRPFVDEPTCSFYTLSVDCYREGNKFRMNVRKAMLQSMSGTLTTASLSGFRARTILIKDVKII